MTISSTNRKAGPYSGNDSTTVFPFAFKVFSTEDVFVVRADANGAETVLILDSGYTVLLNADQDANPGGSVTLPAALATGDTLTISSALENLQPTELTSQGGFYPRVITNALDRLTILVQQIAEAVSRSLKMAISTPAGVDPQLPAPAPNSIIGWNDAGDGFANYDPLYPSSILEDLASVEAGQGAALVGFLPPGSGATARTVAGKLGEFVSVKDFGAVGDGVADDSAAVALAFQRGDVFFPADTVYNLNGHELIVANSVVCRFGNNVHFKNGRLSFRPSDAAKRVVFSGHLSMIDGSVRVASSARDLAHVDPSSPDQYAVTLTCDNITVSNIFVKAGMTVTTSVDLWNLKNSRIGVVSVSGTAGGVAGSAGIMTQDIYDSEILGFHVAGGWAMGVHIDSASERAAYSLCRSWIGFVNVSKNIADESGDHGCYFHGAFRSAIAVVAGTGWGDTISSCADFKFRDNIGCHVRSVNVGRFRITADNNYAFFEIINRDNVFDEVNCSIGMSTVSTSPGYSLNNTIRNLIAPAYSADSNKATQGGFILSGTCSIGVATAGDDINAYGIVFKDADVTLINSPDFVGNYFTALNSTFVGNLSLVPAAASTTTLQHVRVNGAFTHNGASAAHVFNWEHTHVTGAISIASSGVARTTTANWRYVSSDAAEIADTTYRPETKNYRFVAFSDAVYDLL